MTLTTISVGHNIKARSDSLSFSHFLAAAAMSTPREDMDILLDEGIEAATQFLEENGEFCPFAVVLSAGGEVRYLQCEPDDEFTQSEGLIEITENTLKELAESGEVRATVLIADVFIHGKDESDPDTDAIRLSMEHITTGAVICYLPYTVGEEEIVMGELVAEEGEAVIFPEKETEEPGDPEIDESLLN